MKKKKKNIFGISYTAELIFILPQVNRIGVGRFRLLGGGGGGGGGARGGRIPSKHMTSYRRRCDVTTSHRCHFDVMCPHGF